MAVLDASDKLTLDRAKSAELSRDYDMAERLYKELLQKDSSNIELLSALGKLYEKGRKFPEALEQYEKVLALDPKNMGALNSLGSIYRQLKQYRNSISALEQGIIVDEHNTQVFYNLGFTYKDLGKYPEAEFCFNTVISHNPNDVLAYNHLGSIYCLQQHYAKAVPVFQRGLKVDPNHPILHMNLAKAYEGLGDLDKAGQEYEAALRSKPGWLDAIDGYADLLLQKNSTSLARDLVQQAVRLNPNDAGMHTKLGNVYVRQSDFPDAEEEYNAALEIAPESTSALSGLAEAYEADGKLQKAIETMEKYERLSPDDMKMLKQYTSVLLSADKLDSAVRKIKELWAKNPDDMQTLNLLGQYYICNGEEAKARSCFKRIDRLAPEYTDHYRDGARRYEQKGLHQKAEAHLQHYLKTNPGDEKALSLLATSYEKQGRLDDALSTYRRLADSDSGNKSYRSSVERMSSAIAQQGQTALDAEPAFVAEQHAPAAVYVDDAASAAQPAVPRAAHAAKQPSAASPVEDVDNVGLMDDIAPDLNFETLTENDDDISPFAIIDDEILASGNNADSLDNLVSDDDRMDDFFAENPFGSSPVAGRASPAPFEAASEPDFTEEVLGSGGGEDDMPIDLDDAEDIQPEPPKAKESAPDFGLEPEPEPEPEPDASPVEEMPGFATDDFSADEAEEEEPLLADMGADELSPEEEEPLVPGTPDFGLEGDLEPASAEAEEDEMPGFEVEDLSMPDDDGTDAIELSDLEDDSGLAPDASGLEQELASTDISEEIPAGEEEPLPSDMGADDLSGEDAEEPLVPESPDFGAEDGLEPDSGEDAGAEALDGNEDFEIPGFTEGEEAGAEEAEDEHKEFELPDSIYDEEELPELPLDEPDFGADDLSVPGELKELPSDEDLAPAFDESDDFVAPALPDDIDDTLAPLDDVPGAEPEEAAAEEEAPAAGAEPAPDEDGELPLDEPSVFPVDESEDRFADEEIPVEVDEEEAAEILQREELPELEEVPPEEDTLSGPPVSPSLLDDARHLLSQIAEAINNRAAAQQYHQMTDMLLKLRSLVEFLPEGSREAFLSSREHVLMEYLISRLSGNAGLFATSEVLRRELNLDDGGFPPRMEGRELAAKVLGAMLPLLAGLPDKGIAAALKADIENVLSRLR